MVHAVAPGSPLLSAGARPGESEGGAHHQALQSPQVDKVMMDEPTQADVPVRTRWGPVLVIVRVH